MSLEPFFELVIADSVSIISEALGIPEPTVELAVRHTFTCPNQPCEVEEFLNQRMLAAAARNTGIAPDRIFELVSSVAKSVGDSLRLLENAGEKLTPEQIRDAYRQARDTNDAGMRLMMEEQQ